MEIGPKSGVMVQWHSVSPRSRTHRQDNDKTSDVQPLVVAEFFEISMGYLGKPEAR
jgi:hypothetical protein